VDFSVRDGNVKTTNSTSTEQRSKDKTPPVPKDITVHLLPTCIVSTQLHPDQGLPSSSTSSETTFFHIRHDPEPSVILFNVRSKIKAITPSKKAPS
jgi:hypothetical protein